MPSVALRFGLIMEAYCRGSTHHMRVLMKQVRLGTPCPCPRLSFTLGQGQPGPFRISWPAHATLPFSWPGRSAEQAEGPE